MLKQAMLMDLHMQLQSMAQQQNIISIIANKLLQCMLFITFIFFRERITQRCYTAMCYVSQWL